MKKTAIREKQTQGQIIADLADETGLSRSQVARVLEALANQVHRSLKPRSVGEITLPKLHLRLKRATRKAMKAREGINPRTGERMKIASRPARKVIRVRALKRAEEFLS